MKLKLLFEACGRFVALTESREAEWQYQATESALEETGYNDFVAGLTSSQRRRLHAELSHHLMTSLTGPMGWAEMEEAGRTMDALNNSHERLSKLLNILMPSQEELEEMCGPVQDERKKISVKISAKGVSE